MHYEVLIFTIIFSLQALLEANVFEMGIIFSYLLKHTLFSVFLCAAVYTGPYFFLAFQAKMAIYLYKHHLGIWGSHLCHSRTVIRFFSGCSYLNVIRVLLRVFER